MLADLRDFHLRSFVMFSSCFLYLLVFLFLTLSPCLGFALAQFRNQQLVRLRNSITAVYLLVLLFLLCHYILDFFLPCFLSFLCSSVYASARLCFVIIRHLHFEGFFETVQSLLLSVFVFLIINIIIIFFQSWLAAVSDSGVSERGLLVGRGDSACFVVSSSSSFTMVIVMFGIVNSFIVQMKSLYPQLITVAAVLRMFLDFFEFLSFCLPPFLFLPFLLGVYRLTQRWSGLYRCRYTFMNVFCACHVDIISMYSFYFNAILFPRIQRSGSFLLHGLPRVYCLRCRTLQHEGPRGGMWVFVFFFVYLYAYRLTYTIWLSSHAYIFVSFVNFVLWYVPSNVLPALPHAATRWTVWRNVSFYSFNVPLHLHVSNVFSSSWLSSSSLLLHIVWFFIDYFPG